MKKLTKYLLLALLVLLFSVSCVLVACEEPEPTPEGKVTVTFDSGVEGLQIPSQTIDKGSLATAPQVDSAYQVLGWYTTSSCVTEFDFSKGVNNDVTVYGKILKGEGTSENPFEIGSAQALSAFTTHGSGHGFVGKVVADFEYTSLVNTKYSATEFNGSIDGQGHTITLVASNTGIFYKLSETASIKNLKVVGHIEAAVGSCGVVANHNYGTITNVTSEGTEVHWNNDGDVTNGFANGIFSVSGTVGTRADALAGENGADAIAGAGGIVGTNYKGAIIKDCTNRMNVRAVVGGGGIAAVNYGTIEHCFNDGCVGTTGDTAANMTTAYDFSYLGGMAGINYGTIKQCGNLNKVYAHRLPWLYTADNQATNYRMNIGGIAGDNVAVLEDGATVGGIITECFNYGRIHGDMRVGGIAGQSNGVITHCASYGYFGARNYLGAIVGFQRDDNYGIVDSCSGMMRVKSSQSSKIKDSEGVEHQVEPLDDGRVSENTNTIANYYCIAKYATNSAFHNNCGNIAPIDPATGDKGSNTTTKGAELFNAFAELNYDNSGKWAEDTIDATNHHTSTMVAISKHYQIYLSLYLSWQKATITAVDLNGTSHTVDARQGINYTQKALLWSATDSVWDKNKSNRNLSGWLPTKGLPELTAPDGKMVIWTLVKNDATTEWNGICTGNVTVYAMLVDKPAD